jgi:hypothetical protein
LQARFDQAAAEFAAEVLPLKLAGAGEELARRVAFFERHCLEEHHAVMAGLPGWRVEAAESHGDLAVSR